MRMHGLCRYPHLVKTICYSLQFPPPSSAFIEKRRRRARYRTVGDVELEIIPQTLFPDVVHLRAVKIEVCSNIPGLGSNIPGLDAMAVPERSGVRRHRLGHGTYFS